MSNFGTNSPFYTNSNPNAATRVSALFAAAAILLGANPATAAIAYTGGVPSSMTLDGVTSAVQMTGGKVTRLGGLSELPAWSRSTVAVNNNGSEVAINTPRYRYGRNLLTKNMSDIETDTTGFFTALGAIQTRVTDTYWQGSACLRVVTPGAAGAEGIATTTIDVAGPSLTYTASAYVKGSGTITLALIERTSTGAYVGEVGSTVTLTSAWQRVTISRTFGSTGTKGAIAIRTNSIQAITFYCDGLQFEQAAAATEWTEGGEQGAFFGDEVTNLCSANQSSIETDTTGFVARGGTITRVTTEKWTGTASLGVTTPGAVFDEGFNTTDITAAPSTVYTYTVYVKGNGGGTVRVTLYEWTSAGAFITGTNGPTVTLNGGWQRLSITVTTQATTGRVGLAVNTAAPQAITFHVDGLQFEQRGYATSWALGGTTRNADIGTAPSPGTMRSEEGTISIRFNVETLKSAQSMFLLDAGGTGATGFTISIQYDGGSPKMAFQVGDGTISNIIRGTTALVAGTTYEVTCRWNKITRTLSIFLNGVLEITTTDQSINFTTYADYVYFGNNRDNLARALNGTIYHARFFDKALTDTEIAAFTATWRPDVEPDRQRIVVPFDGTLAYKARVATLTYDGSNLASITGETVTIAA